MYYKCITYLQVKYERIIDMRWLSKKKKNILKIMNQQIAAKFSPLYRLAFFFALSISIAFSTIRQTYQRKNFEACDLQHIKLFDHTWPDIPSSKLTLSWHSSYLQRVLDLFLYVNVLGSSRKKVFKLIVMAFQEGKKLNGQSTNDNLSLRSSPSSFIQSIQLSTFDQYYLSSVISYSKGMCRRCYAIGQCDKNV